MNKPTKPNITIPESFAANGIKTDFDNEKLTNGFDRLQPDVLAGDNLNKFIDDTYKGLNYGIAAGDAINLIQEGETLTVQNGQLVSGSTGSGLEVCDIGMALYVDETKGLRRYLNGQIVDINTNTQKFLNRLKQITTLYPSLLCTEEEWQSAKTLSAFGQVGKFVFNYSGDEIVSVRIPRVVNVQGLFDLQNLGLTVNAGLPNITGEFGKTQTISNDSYGNGAFTCVHEGSAGDSNGGATKLYHWTFDASRSSSIYGKSNTVQPEAIQYPYFIQIATGSETENNIINDIELNNPYSLFDSKYSDHELNNLSWLKSKGQWNAKAVYPTAYDELLKEYNNPDRLATFNKDAFEVVGSPTITDDGVASGFSSSNYLRINQQLDFSKPFVIKGEFNSGSDITTEQFIWATTINNQAFALQKFKDSTLVLYVSGQNRRGPALIANTDYQYEITYNGSVVTWKYGIKGQTLNTYPSITTSLGSASFINIGTGRTSQFPLISGSIDLNAFKIYVDGKRVFSGANSMVKLSTEDYTDYDFVINTANETFRLPLKNHTADDGIEGLTLYYYVGETVQNANLIDAGRIGEQLANKVDITSPQMLAPYLKSTYVNGTSGYRIWSDGYCEQWGSTSTIRNGSKNINFLKEFKDNSYYINGNRAIIATSLSGVYTFNFAKQQSYFVCVANIDTIVNWKASGYLAEGEY